MTECGFCGHEESQHMMEKTPEARPQKYCMAEFCPCANFETESPFFTAEERKKMVIDAEPSEKP